MNAVASENRPNAARGGSGSCVDRSALVGALAWNSLTSNDFQARLTDQRGSAFGHFVSQIGVNDPSAGLSLSSVWLIDRPIHDAMWNDPPYRYAQEDFSEFSLHAGTRSGRVPVEPSNERIPAAGYRRPAVLSVTSIQGASPS